MAFIQVENLIERNNMPSSSWCMREALDIAKAHASSGNTRPVEDVVKEIYEYLKSKTDI